MKYFACLLNLLIQDSFTVGRGSRSITAKFAPCQFEGSCRREDEKATLLMCLLRWIASFAKMHRKAAPIPPSSADDAFQNE